jgi:photosystem II stability/assembly factor-like uncharacterized protein
MKNFGILLVASTVLLTANFAPAQTWTQTSAPTNFGWSCVASSADGTKLVAVGSDSIFTSTDSGTTWISNNVPHKLWNHVATSSDGSKLAATSTALGQPLGSLLTSMDSGATWISNSVPNAAWNSIAFSADGNRLVAVGSGKIFISTNSGTTWASTNTDEHWEIVASSADGTKLVAAASMVFPPTPRIYTSTNSGSSWTLMNSLLSASAIASSADGTKLAAIVERSIYVSTNSGIAWAITSAPATNWVSIASSADGSRLVVVAERTDNFGPFPPTISGVIYSSTNSGATWVSNSAPVLNWTSVASSSDGGKLVVVAGSFNGGGIWTSQSTPAPRMNITPTNGNLAFSWLVPSANFVMQQSPDLISWMDVTNPPVLNLTNLQNEVTLPLMGSNAFYRLKTP